MPSFRCVTSPVPTFALPRNVAFSLTTSRGASMSPRSVQPAWSSQHSVTKISPSAVPRTFTDFALISPRMRACSPIVSVPMESIVPSSSPSMNSSFRNLTDPLIETPRERRAPLADLFAGAADSVFRVDRANNWRHRKRIKNVEIKAKFVVLLIGALTCAECASTSTLK
jgi:hypothetical protein